MCSDTNPLFWTKMYVRDNKRLRSTVLIFRCLFAPILANSHYRQYAGLHARRYVWICTALYISNNTLSIFSLNVPMQFLPGYAGFWSLNPSLHSHVKLPSLFWQVALLWQSWKFVKHSSKSEKKKKSSTQPIPFA